MERALGEKLPFSIATAIPLEEQLVIEKPAGNLVWANIRTMARNFWGSYETSNRPNVTVMMPLFIEELTNIAYLLNQNGVEIKYYAPSYASLRGLKHAKVRRPKSEKQITYFNAEEVLTDWATRNEGLNVTAVNTKLLGDNNDVLLLSHYPVDLLYRHSFSKLRLLESSTGAIKEPMSWNTKLNLPKEYPGIPFNELTLQVFGDKGKHFNALPRAVKMELVELAKKSRWLPTTTKNKIEYDLKKLNDFGIEMIFKDMLRVSFK